MPNRGRLIANCTTNIFCANTDATPTTDRLKPHEPSFIFVERIHAGPFVASGHGHHRLLLRAGAGDRFLSQRTGEHRRRLLYGRPGNDSVGWGPGLSFGESG